ncbi:MAG TPA: hypothetical protein DEF45_05315 [Rhodopirellula sp.]|nr:hypothetical protein [Rhodopirellula sp.]
MRADIHSSSGQILDVDLTFIAIPTRVTTIAGDQKFNPCPGKSQKFLRNKTKVASRLRLKSINDKPAW